MNLKNSKYTVLFWEKSRPIIAIFKILDLANLESTILLEETQRDYLIRTEMISPRKVKDCPGFMSKTERMSRKICHSDISKIQESPYCFARTQGNVS